MSTPGERSAGPADIDSVDTDSVDVVVIGAGPSGSIAAMTLAEAGRSVLMLERRTLPRFHIGESQLTYMAELLRQLGLREEALAQGYPTKTGAEFIFPNGDFRRTNFADQGAGRLTTTIQVERGHFDHLLARNAVRRGARLVQNAVVHDLVITDGRVTGVRYEVDGVPHVARAAWVLDCGGRASRTAAHFRTRKEIPWLRNIAVYRHYDNLDERHNPGQPGDIQVGGHADGWIWAIPIWSDTISIGAVMPRAVLRAGESPEAVFAEHLARVPRVVRRLTGAVARPQVRVETDYCYVSDTLTGPGWMLAGDAGNFIDPIFSGGAFLAGVSGREAARTLHRILDQPDRAPRLQEAYSNFVKTGYDSYARLISAYYASEYKLGGYLIERGFSIEGDPWFTQVLSGDFWSDQNPVTEWLRGQHEWDTFEPYERVRVCPIYPELDAAERARRSREPAGAATG